MQMSLSNGDIYPNLAANGILGIAKVVTAGILHLVRLNWPLFALLVAALFSLTSTCENRSISSLLKNRWVCAFILALCMLPSSALGRTKLGGDVNHESFVVFFLCAAVLLWLLETQMTQSSKIACMGTLLGVLTLVNGPRILAYPGWNNAWHNQNETAFLFQRDHTDEVYFPWNPLSSLLTNRKLYHFDYGVFDRNLGNARVRPEHLSAALPSSNPIIASYVAHHDFILQTYFPDYVPMPPKPQLPGWKLWGPKSAAKTQGKRAEPSSPSP